MSGKWHLGSTLETCPATRGFKRSFALLPGAANHYASSPKAGTGFPKQATLYTEDAAFTDLTDDFYSSDGRSEEHTSELQSLMRTPYAVFCLKNKNMKMQ